MPKTLLIWTLLLLGCLPALGQFRSYTINLSGKVVLEGGGAPPELVQIERFCGARVFPAGFTDAKGNFNVRVGSGDPGATLPDAANQGTDFRGRGIGDPTTTGGLTGRTESMSTVRNAGTIDLYGCDLRARLEGYRSDAIALGRRNIGDKPDIGTIVLHPYEGVKGALISATNLQAPSGSQKLFARAQKESWKAKPNLDKARKDLEKAIEAYPTYAAAWDLLGKTRLALQDEPGALEAYSKALDADGMYLRPYVPLIKLNVRSGEWLRTLMLSSNLQNLNPGSLDARFYSALAAFQLERYEDAEQSITALLSDENAAREFPMAYHLQGMIYSKRGEFEVAAKAYREFVKGNPESPTAVEVARQLGEWEALGVISKASN
jgi:tetratricopeptide (TPR) repeat protein